MKKLILAALVATSFNVMASDASIGTPVISNCDAGQIEVLIPSNSRRGIQLDSLVGTQAGKLICIEENLAHSTLSQSSDASISADAGINPVEEKCSADETLGYVIEVLDDSFIKPIKEVCLESNISEIVVEGKEVSRCANDFIAMAFDLESLDNEIVSLNSQLLRYPSFEERASLRSRLFEVEGSRKSVVRQITRYRCQ